jgi:hypothetical protein
MLAHTRWDSVVCTHKRFTLLADGGVRRRQLERSVAVLLPALGCCEAAAWSLGSTARLGGTHNVFGSLGLDRAKISSHSGLDGGKPDKTSRKRHRTLTQNTEKYLATIANTLSV